MADAFNWVYMFFALLPFLFFFKMQRRERNWLITVAAIYPFLGVLLTVFLNPQKDRQSVELLRVFFAASHTVVAILIGYGLALTVAYMATHYDRFRRWGWVGGAMALVLAWFCLGDAAQGLYFGQGLGEPSAMSTLGLGEFGRLLLVIGAVVFPLLAAYSRRRSGASLRTRFLGRLAAYYILGLVLVVMATFLVGHEGEASSGTLLKLVAQAFAPGQYALPIYGNLLLVALPAIFLGALAVYRTRAPLLVTLGLFAVMPVCSGLSHWFHSEQHGHWFGYWYGHDMFTPPFAGPDGKLTYDPAWREQAMKGTNGSLIYPEMARDAVVYGGTDRGGSARLT